MDTVFIDYSDEKIWETNQETPLYLRKRKKGKLTNAYTCKRLRHVN